jgi:hypothetical protein
MHGFIEFVGQFRRTILPHPRIASIPHDLQEPRPAISTAKAIKESERPEKRLLHHIVRVSRATHEPPRQVVRSVKVR